MRYSVERSLDAESDLRAILRFLASTHLGFGHSHAEAKQLATSRLRIIRDAMKALGKVPKQGTLSRG